MSHWLALAMNCLGLDIIYLNQLYVQQNLYFAIIILLLGVVQMATVAYKMKVMSCAEMNYAKSARKMLINPRLS
jgi:hypothetical protein